MAQIRDPYQVLGVSSTASADDIKKAYRKLAKQHHPDLKPGRSGNEERFKEISAAYTILSDPEKRARYDRSEIDANGNEHRASSSSYQRPPGARAQTRSTDDGGAHDWFSDLFGNRKRSGARGGAESAGKTRGADISYSVTVPFLEAANGAKRRVNLSNGKSIDVTIPPGTEDQQKLRLKGQGLSNQAGDNAGDAIIEVHVESHPHFTRQGDNIHIELPITLDEAVLGASIRVPTVGGMVAMKVPAGSNTGLVLLLRGKGVINQKTKQSGDQHVTLKVVLPSPPDTELIQFMEKWAKTRHYDVRKKMGLE